MQSQLLPTLLPLKSIFGETLTMRHYWSVSHPVMFLTQKIDGNFLASMMLLEENNCGIDEKKLWFTFQTLHFIYVQNCLIYSLNILLQLQSFSLIEVLLNSFKSVLSLFMGSLPVHFFFNIYFNSHRHVNYNVVIN